MPSATCARTEPCGGGRTQAFGCNTRASFMSTAASARPACRCAHAAALPRRTRLGFPGAPKRCVRRRITNTREEVWPDGAPEDQVEEGTTVTRFPSMSKFNGPLERKVSRCARVNVRFDFSIPYSFSRCSCRHNGAPGTARGAHPCAGPSRTPFSTSVSALRRWSSGLTRANLVRGRMGLGSHSGRADCV